MKKTLLILAISALTLSLNAYVPMLQNGKTWTHLMHYVSNGDNVIQTFQSRINGDTIINGNVYFRYEYGDIKYVREDVDNQKVYIFDDVDMQDKILYDFSLNVGDSVEIYNGQHYPTDITPDKEIDLAKISRIYIIKIDTVTDEMGNQLRQFHFTSPYLDVEGLEWTGIDRYIEGYGSTSTFLSQYGLLKICYGCASGQLRCVTDSTGSLMLMRHSDFLDTNLGDACEGSGHYLAVENTPSSQVSIAYSNNTLSINAENINNVEIFTAAGVMVGCYQASEINISLTPGIYFARISADGRVSTERFIVK